MPRPRVESDRLPDRLAESIVDETAAGDDAPLHDRVYRSLRDALITGRIVPGRAVTLRGLAQSLGVSPMPVREAIRRVSAEGGLVVGPNRRVWVPAMDADRFDELVAARSLLEPMRARVGGVGIWACGV